MRTAAWGCSLAQAGPCVFHTTTAIPNRQQQEPQRHGSRGSAAADPQHFRLTVHSTPSTAPPAAHMAVQQPGAGVVGVHQDRHRGAGQQLDLVVAHAVPLERVAVPVPVGGGRVNGRANGRGRGREENAGHWPSWLGRQLKKVRVRRPTSNAVGWVGLGGLHRKASSSAESPARKALLNPSACGSAPARRACFQCRCEAAWLKLDTLSTFKLQPSHQCRLWRSPSEPTTATCHRTLRGARWDSLSRQAGWMAGRQAGCQARTPPPSEPSTACHFCTRLACYAPCHRSNPRSLPEEGEIPSQTYITKASRTLPTHPPPAHSPLALHHLRPGAAAVSAHLSCIHACSCH